jgi:hypothetical protein
MQNFFKGGSGGSGGKGYGGSLLLAPTEAAVLLAATDQYQ